MTEDSTEVGICNEAGIRRLVPTDIEAQLSYSRLGKAQEICLDLFGHLLLAVLLSQVVT